jgi:hypothetical protein
VEAVVAVRLGLDEHLTIDKRHFLLEGKGSVLAMKQLPMFNFTQTMVIQRKKFFLGFSLVFVWFLFFFDKVKWHLHRPHRHPTEPCPS